MKRTSLTIIASLALATTLSACGGSSQAPGVELAPGAGLTQVPIVAPPKVPAALSKKPVVVVPSGPPPTTLVTKDLVQGTGKPAHAGSTITVNYVGLLYKTGKEFGSSWSSNNPLTTQLIPSGLIQGWTQGIPGMKVGGRRELIIPAALAYGPAGRPPAIPPNSPLVFVIDLLSTS